MTDFDRRSLLRLATATSLVGATANRAVAAPPPTADTGFHELIIRFCDAFNGGDIATLIDAHMPQFRMDVGGRVFDMASDGKEAVIAAIGMLKAQLGEISRYPGAGEYLVEPGGRRLTAFVNFSGTAPANASCCTVTLWVMGDRTKTLTGVDFGARSPGVNSMVVPLSGDEDIDCSVAAQQAYDMLAKSGGGILAFPAGRYRMNLVLHDRNVDLAGSGPQATILKPAKTGVPILRAVYSVGSWDSVRIENIALEGDDMQRDIGFQAGHGAYAVNDEFSGRSEFRRVRFDNLHKCVSRPTGQIGLRIVECQFEAADYHLHSIGGHDMHSGVVDIRHSHFQRSEKAVFYMDSPIVGSGQISIADSTFEGNQGFVFFVKSMSGTEAVPGMTVSRCWNEQNYTATTVEIDGQNYRPSFGYIRSVVRIEFDDTPVGNMTISESSVVTRNCALDLLQEVDIDSTSSLEHLDARAFGGKTPPGLVRSVSRTFQSTRGATACFTMPLPRGNTRAYREDILLSEAYSQPRTLSGSASARTTSAPGGVLDGQQIVGQLRIPGGQTLYLPGVDLTAGTWLTWTHSFRVLAGEVAIKVDGGRGVSAISRHRQGNWTNIAGLTFIEDDARDVSIRHTAGSAGTTIQMAASNLLGFAELETALEYLRSGTFAAP